MLLALSLLLSLSAYADFTDEHATLCSTPDVHKLMGKNGSCQIVIGKVDTNQVSGRCEGKLSDITCRVSILKTSDSTSMTLVCGDTTSPLLSQVLQADILSYNVSALVKNGKGETVTINDPKTYHVLSNPALEVQLAQGENVQGKMILTLTDKSIQLSNVVCQ
jgi:hypothetical protein